MQHQNEKDQAWEAQKAAELEAEKAYISTQVDRHRLSIPGLKRIQMLQEANNRLVAAQKSYEFSERRSYLITNFIRGTFDYINAKKDAARHAILVQWILEQASLVEAELQPATTEVASTRSRKRRVTFGEPSSGEQSPKKQKRNRGELGRLSRSSAAVPAQGKGPLAIHGDGSGSRGGVQGSDQTSHQAFTSVSGRLSSAVSRATSQRTGCGSPSHRQPGKTPEASLVQHKLKAFCDIEEGNQDRHSTGCIQAHRGV
ncbi:hypothetical protein TOPH_06873 [Tolypocladium ophioglossoides CBS 100239]|uniref:Uncharacterized protein n=1 Tax=Tolypocladium ophioglossoides (strain CBS 100239) TaxID=1163406 RepID=A0A0L0N3T1_TOLOC|nr:hypothetical protein TOPH_06873 [Tolypocladium ophioglossoides CBS 100239]